MGCPQAQPLRGWNYLKNRIEITLTAILKPVGIIKQYTKGLNELIVQSGQSIREMLLSMGIPPDIVALVLVNEVPVNKDHVISDGEMIQVIAVIGGG